MTVVNGVEIDCFNIKPNTINLAIMSTSLTSKQRSQMSRDEIAYFLGVSNIMVSSWLIGYRYR